jgi:hypothetical protein
MNKDWSTIRERYLRDDVSVRLGGLAETKIENQHRHKGFNLFSEEHTCLFRTLLQGEFSISGFTNKQLRTQYLSNKSASQVTRLLKRLRVHGVIKKNW